MLFNFNLTLTGLSSSLRPPTPEVDPTVVSLALRLHEPKSHDDGASDSSDDNILDDLEKEIEDDFDMGALREQRMEELKREYVDTWMLFRRRETDKISQDDTCKEHAGTRPRTRE